MATLDSLFSTDPGKIQDFSTLSPADIFNKGVVPQIASLEQLLGADPGGLEGASQRRDQQLQQDIRSDLFQQQEDDQFLDTMLARRNQPSLSAAPGVAEDVDYNAPIPSTTATPTNPAVPADPSTPDNEPKGARVVGTVNAKGLTDFVKEFEGFNPSAYDDFSQTSIGYGTKARKGEKAISKAEAEARLGQELASHRARVEAINRKHGYNFTDNQMDALTSFDYNTGSIEQLTANGARDKATIAAKIAEYNKAGGKPLKGLTRRRLAEQQLFINGYGN